MKNQWWSVWLNSWWLSKRLWNVDKVLVECWNNDENVNVLKWHVWGGYIIVLRWILNRLWDVDWAIMNLGYWWMIVWVLWRIYCCILLDVIVTNGCMSIMKDLMLYFIECSRDEWLYKYYEGSIVVLYWTLIVMNAWMSNTKGVLLWYWILNCYRMFVCVLQRIYYCVYWMLNYYGTLVRVSRRVCYYVAVNVKLLWIVWMSNSRVLIML